MKMNATKLTIALVALLLALTCVFAACGKNETQPVDNNKPGDTIINEGDQITNNYNYDRSYLVEIGENFNKAYVQNYLNLYSDEVAVELESKKSEALLKIAAQDTKEKAQEIADDFINNVLKKARTLADDAEALIAKIADVTLSDEANIKVLSKLNSRLLEAIPTASGKKLEVLNAYKTKNAAKVQDLEWRIVVLKAAKSVADQTVNSDIVEFVEKVELAKAAVYDSDFEDGNYLGFADLDTYHILKAKVAVLAEAYELVPDTAAYKEILKEADLDAAKALFDQKVNVNEETGERIDETKPCNEQYKRAIDMMNVAKALANVALKYSITGYSTYNEDNVDLFDQIFAQIDTEGPYYFILRSNFKAGQETKDGLTDPVLVTETINGAKGKSLWVEKADVYAFLPSFWDKENTIDVIQVTVSTKVDDDVTTSNPFDYTKVEIPVKGSEFKLDPELQAAAENAAEIATAWAKLIDQSGNLDLNEEVANKFYYGVIKPILEDYNASLAKAVADFDAFADALVVMNYVASYPEKEDTYNEFVTTTDTQTITPETSTEDWWKAKLLAEIVALKEEAETYDGKKLSTYFKNLPGDGLYEVSGRTNENGTILENSYFITLKDNGDGTYTPAFLYSVYTYLWKAYDQTITHDNTKVLSDVFGDEGLKILAQALLDWVDKYLPEIPEDAFDLTPYKTVKSEKIFPEAVAVAFGQDELTFADDKLVEEAVPTVIKIGGEEVEATASAPLADITLYSDYNVAKAIAGYVAPGEAPVDTQADDIDELEKAVKRIFVYNPDAANVIAAARDKYNEVSAKYPSVDLSRYDITITKAEELLADALELYPHGEWDAALATLKAALDAAQNAVDAKAGEIAAQEARIEKAEDILAYLKVGNTIGWFEHVIKYQQDEEGKYVLDDEGKKIVIAEYDRECKLVTNAQVKAAQKALDDLKAAKKDLEDEKKDLDAALADAQAKFDAALAEFVANFKLDAKKSYDADFDALDALIAKMEDFAGDYDYINFNVINDYTGNLVDLFSQIFNERILAAYANSIHRTMKYALLKASNCDGLENVDEFLEYVETAWLEYAWNQFDRDDNDEKTSELTFTSIAAGKAAVAKIWRSKYINYRTWAVEAINRAAGSEIADYDELMYYIQFGKLPA